jgi:type IV pilus assembly protein PilB
MLSKQMLTELLLDKYHIDAKALADITERANKLGKTPEQYLTDEGTVEEGDLYAAAAKKMNVPYVELKGREIKKDILNIVPAPLAQAHSIVAYDKTDTALKIAMLDPLDIETVEFIERKSGLKTDVALTSPGDIRDALRRYHADLGEDMLVVQLATGGAAPETGDLKKAAEEISIVNIVNSILEHAVYENASDIHIEPTEREVVVRYRVDGVLENVMSLPKSVQNGIIARVKILSNLKIDEHMLPQDGRFKIQVQEDKLSFRVSIMPVYDGEKITMRLLREGQKPLSLEELGFLPQAKALIEAAIAKPHGMVLVTGPTGSGKTTTLYSILGILNRPDVNICTIEDPIEYHVKGINQSQVNPRVGFTFALGLRAFLRQDPDVMMVGEIRDVETAEVGVHAALTGHLVLSTLHTNDAPTTLPRLMDMGIPPFLVAFTTNIIIAQRLVRKICEFCKKPFHIDKKAIAEFEKLCDLKTYLDILKTQGVRLAASEKTLQTMQFYRGEGCRRCNNNGYKGRIGIYEAMDVDKELINKINARATANDIRDYALKRGMITMLQDGLVKAKQGVTTIEEVLRATRD